MPNPESAARSSLIPESEVESAESLPLSDEPAAAVISEQASSVTLTEISPDQTPAETNPGTVDIDLCLPVSLSTLLHTPLHSGFD